MSKVPLEELRSYPQYRGLTASQRLYVDHYIENGYDALLACTTAYKCSKNNSARSRSFQLQNEPSIQMVLDLHFGDSPAIAMARFLYRKLIGGTLTKMHIDGIRLYAQLIGVAPWEDKKGKKDDTKQDQDNTKIPLLGDYK